MTLEILELLLRLEQRLDPLAQGVGLVNDSWACSRLFQKVSAAIKALISPRRFCAPGTSKKPPHVRQLVPGGCQFRFNRVEHPANLVCRRARRK